MIKMLAVVRSSTPDAAQELLNRPHFTGDKNWQVAKWVTVNRGDDGDGVSDSDGGQSGSASRITESFAHRCLGVCPLLHLHHFITGITSITGITDITSITYL